MKRVETETKVGRELAMTRILVTTAALAVGCISASPAAQNVRMTSNLEVVHGCKFLGNVRATSGWGGHAGTGIAGHNTDVALREKTAKLGGNVVFVVQSGIHAAGEAYRCPSEGDGR
jgi:hypothetical protein